MLYDLQSEFEHLYSSNLGRGLKLYCYYETKEVSMSWRMVHKDSATLDYAASRSMDVNHLEMNKFVTTRTARETTTTTTLSAI